MNALTYSDEPEDGEGPKRILCRGRPVMTTDQLAQAYRVSADNIHDGLRKNPTRFAEGVHFYKLIGAELRAFKDRPENSRSVGANANALLLWTDRGAARHAKLLESEEAWAVFERLEDTYFAIRVGAVSPPSTVDAREKRLQFDHHLRIAKMCGLGDKLAVFAANRGTYRLTGHDTLAAMGVPALPDDRQEIMLIPTGIGERVDGLSAKAVNKILHAMGLQERESLHRGKWRWALTDKGSAAGGRYDLTDRSNKTGTARLIEWPASIVDSVRAFICGGGDA